MMAQCLQRQQINFSVHSGNDDATELLRTQHAVHCEPRCAAVSIDERMNFGYYEHHREEDIAASLSKMAFGLARLRLKLLGKLGWRSLIRFRQQRALWKDLLRGLFLLLFRGSNLRKNWLVRMKFASHEMTVESNNRRASSGDLTQRQSQEERH